MLGPSLVLVVLASQQPTAEEVGPEQPQAQPEAQPVPEIVVRSVLGERVEMTLLNGVKITVVLVSVEAGQVVVRADDGHMSALELASIGAVRVLPAPSAQMTPEEAERIRAAEQREAEQRREDEAQRREEQEEAERARRNRELRQAAEAQAARTRRAQEFEQREADRSVQKDARLEAERLRLEAKDLDSWALGRWLLAAPLLACGSFLMVGSCGLVAFQWLFFITPVATFTALFLIMSGVFAVGGVCATCGVCAGGSAYKNGQDAEELRIRARSLEGGMAY
jgi:hypothetical protein